MQVSNDRDVIQRLRQALVDAVGPDGGWPYYPGRSSRLEPTCWSLLALSAVEGRADPGIIARGRAFLRGRQRTDGLLVDFGNAGPNYAWNGLALLVDTALVGFEPDPWRDRLIGGLLGAKGIALGEDSSAHQNNSLQGWSWVEGTFSWIEPTAVCVAALKKARVQNSLANVRIAEAEAVIVDRVCDGGGWNFGNAHVLEQDLRPYVPTTALALLAMQDHRQHPGVKQSLSWLVAHATTERAALALSLAAVCLHVFGVRTEDLRSLLVRQEGETQFLGNVHLVAMALFALTLPVHEAQAFVVS